MSIILSSWTFYGSLPSNLYNVETPTNMVYFSIIMVEYFWIIIYTVKDSKGEIIGEVEPDYSDY